MKYVHTLLFWTVFHVTLTGVYQLFIKVIDIPGAGITEMSK